MLVIDVDATFSADICVAGMALRERLPRVVAEKADARTRFIGR